jgi:hypothetical protein
VIYYNGSNWVALTYGTAGKVLTTQGLGSAPTWELGLPGSPVQGDILYFNGTAWTRLAPGTSGYYLETKGAAANPVWSEVQAFPASPNQGEIVYYNGSAWVNLGVGTSGQLLNTNGAGANPSWEDAPAGTTTFTGLTDTPANYTGHGGKLVRVNSTPDALEFVANTVVNGAFSDMPTDYSSDGDIVYTNGSNAWQYQGIGFFLNEKLDNPFPGHGEVVGNSEGTTGWHKLDPQETTENLLLETWVDGSKVYGKLVDFGAGPNATSKSVASGLAITDVYEIVDIRAVMNTPGEGHIAFSSETDEAASFIYNKIDAKVYCDTTTSTNDLSGNTYKVYIKYTKEDDISTGDPPMKINISTGTWGGLAAGVHIIQPKVYAYAYTPDYDTPTNMSFQFTWYGTTATANERLEMDGGFNGTTRDSKCVFKNGATAASWSTKSWSTVTPTGDYAKAKAFGDRLFTAYTAGGMTLTLARTSRLTTRPT